MARRNRRAAPSHPRSDGEGRPEGNKRQTSAPPPPMVRGALKEEDRFALVPMHRWRWITNRRRAPRDTSAPGLVAKTCPNGCPTQPPARLQSSSPAPRACASRPRAGAFNTTSRDGTERVNYGAFVPSPRWRGRALKETNVARLCPRPDGEGHQGERARRVRGLRPGRRWAPLEEHPPTRVRRRSALVPSPRRRGTLGRKRTAARSHPRQLTERDTPKENSDARLRPRHWTKRGRAERRRTLRACALAPMARGHMQKMSSRAPCPRRRRREPSRRTANSRALAPEGRGTRRIITSVAPWALALGSEGRRPEDEHLVRRPSSPMARGLKENTNPRASRPRRRTARGPQREGPRPPASRPQGRGRAPKGKNLRQDSRPCHRL